MGVGKNPIEVDREITFANDLDDPDLARIVLATLPWLVNFDSRHPTTSVT